MKRISKAEKETLFLTRAQEVHSKWMECMMEVILQAMLPVRRNWSPYGIEFLLSQKLNQSNEVTHERWISAASDRQPYENGVDYRWNIIPLYIGSALTDIKAASAEYTYLFCGKEMLSSSADPKSNAAIVEKVIRVNAAGKNPKILYSSGDEKHWSPFPPDMLKQINELMYDNFFDALWVGDLRGGWYWSRTQEIRHLGYSNPGADSTYGNDVGMGNGIIPIEDREALCRLLEETPLQDNLVKLIALTSFSILRPFFKRYKSLNKTMTSERILKRIPEQIYAVALQEECTDEAVTRILRLCCGDVGANGITLAGVHIYTDPRNATTLKTLTQKKFESALCQQGVPLFACKNMSAVCHTTDPDPMIIVLEGIQAYIERLDLIDRMYSQVIHQIELYAAEELARHHLTIQDNCLSVLDELRDTLNQLKEGILLPAEFLRNNHLSWQFRNDVYGDTTNFWEIFKPSIQDVISLPQAFASVHRIQKICMKDIKHCRKDMLKFCSERRKKYIEDETDYGMDHTNEIKVIDLRAKCVEVLFERKEKDVQKLCLNCKRDLVKEYAVLGQDVLYLEPTINAARKILKKSTIPDNQKNRACYLMVSFMKTLEFCDLPAEYIDCLVQALQSNWELPERPNEQPQLERYLLQCIKDNACARIRGEGSENPSTQFWYDPKHEWLLLPRQSYWKKCSAYVYPGIKQKEWENALGDVLFAEERGDQNRRTFNTRVRDGGKGIAVLRVEVDKLSAQFREEPIVQTFITACRNEETVWRVDKKSAPGADLD